MSVRGTGGTGPQFAAVRDYLIVTATLNLVWEAAQLPLYTIWKEGTSGDMVFAVLHCTAGDVVLALALLSCALLAVGGPAWPGRRAGGIAALTMLTGFACTVLIEWLNVVVWRNWAYSDLMPILPPLGTGLSPVLQWLFIPSAALWAAQRASRLSARTAGNI